MLNTTEPTQPETIVSLKGVRKRFGKNEVLRGIEIDVIRGEVVAIIGRSGSGKSTALRCMDYLETIDDGSITVCGHRVNDKTNLKALRLDVGIVFQSYNLFPHLTVEENIMLAPKAVKRLPKREAKELAHRMLREVGLTDKAEQFPEQLSGGQQQRVAIARSLAMQPKVMLFDEVTSALDPQLTGEVLRVIENLARGGMTMIMVTHEMNFARRIADTIIFMHEGTIWEKGPPSMLNNPQTVELKEFLQNEL
ncbi:amino acid ABC transporter ATP-binding protein [Allopusillimonas ginsengisoli]|uniref:amino acid ABC transporter ATP-binding protein n=1 Tax=Allopusillimonas ginsengisoli TaxID=453575 RepID=UPI0039C04AF5